MVRKTAALPLALGIVLAAEAVLAGAVLVHEVCRLVAGEERKP